MTHEEEIQRLEKLLIVAKNAGDNALVQKLTAKLDEEHKKKLGEVAEVVFDVAQLPPVQKAMGKLAEAILRQLKKGHARRVARRKKRRERREERHHG